MPDRRTTPAPTPPPTPAGRAPAVPLLVVAGVSTVVGLFTTIPALLLAIVSTLEHRHSPGRAATLLRWGWIAYAVGAALLVVAGVVLVVVAGVAAGGND